MFFFFFFILQLGKFHEFACTYFGQFIVCAYSIYEKKILNNGGCLLWTQFYNNIFLNIVHRYVMFRVYSVEYNGWGVAQKCDMWWIYHTTILILGLKLHVCALKDNFRFCVPRKLFFLLRIKFSIDRHITDHTTLLILGPKFRFWALRAYFCLFDP
jgi:hypothetical protein